MKQSINLQSDLHEPKFQKQIQENALTNKDVCKFTESLLQRYSETYSPIIINGKLMCNNLKFRPINSVDLYPVVTILLVVRSPLLERLKCKNDT